MSKTEFEESAVRELFPDRSGQRGGRGNQNFEQYFHNNEWRKCWFNLPKELAKVQCDVIYPADDFVIRKYTR